MGRIDLGECRITAGPLVCSDLETVHGPWRPWTKLQLFGNYGQTRNFGEKSGHLLIYDLQLPIFLRYVLLTSNFSGMPDQFKFWHVQWAQAFTFFEFVWSLPVKKYLKVLKIQIITSISANFQKKTGEKFI